VNKFFTLFLVLVFTIRLSAEDQPNIIFTLADDLGYGDLSCYNPKAEGVAPNNTPIKTPNLNSLATNGVRMKDFHSAAPICSPSRRALLTARYQSRLGEWAEAYRGTEDGVDASKDPTIGMWLKQAGYATACYGKWNIGEVAGKSWPGAHGFDDWLIIDHNTGYFDHTNANSNSNGQEMLFGTGGKRVSHLKGTYLTDIWTDKTLKFIEENQKKPFFIYLPVSIPHSPLQSPSDTHMKFNEQAKPRTEAGREVYVSMVEYLDKKMGEIFSFLKDKGLMDNTLIIFTSDNGGMVSGNCWPLKKSKQWLEEGGQRVPTLIQWPKQLPAGKVSEQMAIMMDASVTVLDAAGATEFVPKDRVLDGKSLLPILKGEEEVDNNRSFGWRRRDWGWKGNYIRQEAYRMGDWKLLRTYEYIGKQKWSAEFKDQLFNLKKDLGETQDLAKSMPEKYAEMTKAFDQWRKETVNYDSDFLISIRDQLGSPAVLPGENSPVVLDFSQGKIKDKKVSGYRLFNKGNEDKVNNMKLEEGAFTFTLKGEIASPEPLIYKEGMVNYKKFTKAIVCMKLTAVENTKIGHAKVVLRHTGWKGEDIPFSVNADGKWHDYKVDLTSSSAWNQWTEKGRMGLAVPMLENGEILVSIRGVTLQE
jgi:arylsulfatase A-like enzyme